MELTYHQATLNFPGSISKEILPSKPYVSFNKVTFIRNEFHIEARIHPYFLPYNLSENPLVQREVIEPAVKLVSTDLETLDKVLPVLEDLAKKGIVQNSLIYDREPKGEKFKIYDYSQTFPESYEREDRLFSRILLFKGQNKRIVATENRDLVDLAQYVSQDTEKYPAVEGKTLREAVDRAISIYNLAERLRKIN